MSFIGNAKNGKKIILDQKEVTCYLLSSFNSEALIQFWYQRPLITGSVINYKDNSRGNLIDAGGGVKYSAVYASDAI